MSKKVAFYTFGCKLNSYESEALKSIFHKNGYTLVDFSEPADVYVINTCTVTEKADSNCRRIIRQARRLQEEAMVVATGCYAQRAPETMANDLGVDLVVGNSEKRSLYDHVTALGGDRSQAHRILAQEVPRTVEFLDIDTAWPGSHTRANLQIQDGCSEHCTFCVIPSVRGKSVSRPLHRIIDQARHLVDMGFREVALSGVHVGLYGEDLDQNLNLDDVLEALAAIDGLERIRMNSIEPRYVTDRMIEFVAHSRKMCRHFHIPLQSGDDTILRRMGRRYQSADYRRLLDKIVAKIPDCGLGADVMVGFPGESELHFENTYRFIARLPYTYLHVFSYSERTGTPATRLPDHVPPELKKERSRRLIALGKQKKRAFYTRYQHREVEVLVEGKRDKKRGLLTGLTDNYIKVQLAGPEHWVNQIIRARVTQVLDDAVIAEAIVQ